MEMLVDSGSEVTCMSEATYINLKRENKFPELPVTNLAVYVAVGRKTIKINRKVYLNLKISKFQLEYSFLVVSGLSADLIMGADLLKAIGGIINFQNGTFEMMGEMLPKNIVTFRAVVNNKNQVQSGCYGLKICEQRCIYSNNVSAVNLEIGWNR